MLSILIRLVVTIICERRHVLNIPVCMLQFSKIKMPFLRIIALFAMVCLVLPVNADDGDDFSNNLFTDLAP